MGDRILSASESKILIINADDCNLTPGITRAILKCHDSGILTSTTWMVNLPHDASTVKAVKERKKLGVGIHLNLTLGKPVSPSEHVASLLDGDRRFRKVGHMLEVLPRAQEVRAEYIAQIKKFQKVFGRLPTHLDTHHQVHDHPFYLTILSAIANEMSLPLRRSKLLAEKTQYDFCFKTTDFLIGDLNPAGYWRQEKLGATLKHLQGGVSEIMCHPGIIDNDLKAVSSFTKGRDAEKALFSSARWRLLLAQRGIQLSHYGLCYT